MLEFSELEEFEFYLGERSSIGVIAWGSVFGFLYPQASQLEFEILFNNVH